MGAPKLDLHAMSLPDLMAYYEANRPCCTACGQRMVTLCNGWHCTPCRAVYPFPVEPPAYWGPHEYVDIYRPRGAVGGRWVADGNDAWQDMVEADVARFDKTPGR